MYMLSHMYNFKLYVFHTHNVYDTKIEREYLGRTRKLTGWKGGPGEGVISKFISLYNNYTPKKELKREDQDE